MCQKCTGFMMSHPVYTDKLSDIIYLMGPDSGTCYHSQGKIGDGYLAFVCIPNIQTTFHLKPLVFCSFQQQKHFLCTPNFLQVSIAPVLILSLPEAMDLRLIVLNVGTCNWKLRSHVINRQIMSILRSSLWKVLSTISGHLYTYLHVHTAEQFDKMADTKVWHFWQCNRVESLHNPGNRADVTACVLTNPIITLYCI